MFIIVEGPDGAGKSTFVQQLTLELWRRDRGTVLVNPKRAPRQDVEIEYRVRLDFYQPRSGVDLILDRCWYSDDVYGPVWRGTGLHSAVLERLEDWGMRKGAVVACLDADDAELERRVRERGDDDVAPEEVSRYAVLYRQARQSWLLPTIVNPTLDTIIRFAQEYEQKAKTRK